MNGSTPEVPEPDRRWLWGWLVVVVVALVWYAADYELHAFFAQLPE